MKIIVLIPTLNEEDNIKLVTKIIDRGLTKLAVNVKVDALILNIDSGSTDQTREKFLRTKTIFPKQTILNNCREKGKGFNVFKLLKKFRNSADYFLMFDADVTSIKDEWVNKLLYPLLNQKTDLVIPLYKRNRYEGNTTNHFSSPIIYSLLGKDIAQPVAGDFAFSKRAARKIYQSFSGKSDYHYGVDTLITWTALLNNLHIKQVKLGKKIHKPSFVKIVPMFQEVSDTTFKLINKHRQFLIQNLFKKTQIYYTNQVIDEKFVSKPSIFSLKAIDKYIEDNFRIAKSLKFIDRKFLIKTDKMHANEWSKILAKCLTYILNTKLNAYQINCVSTALTILYLKRILNYFEEIVNLNSSEIDKLLLRQKKLIRKNLIEEIANIRAKTLNKL